MITNPIENLPVRSEPSSSGSLSAMDFIPHDKIQDLDNLVSLVTEARQKVSEYSSPIEPLDIINGSTNILLGYSVSGISLIVGLLLHSKPVYFGGLSLGIALMTIAMITYKSHRYDSPTNIFNIIPRSLSKKKYEKRRMEYLTSQEKRMNELPKYKEAITTVQDKIALLLSEINEEMGLGDNFLSYDATKNVLKLPNKNEYKSPALQQIVLSGEILEKKQNNHEGTHKSIE